MTSTNRLRITDLVTRWAQSHPDRTALVMPDETILNYGDLETAFTSVSRFLSDRGLNRKKRIAVIMPNGPEMVVAFLAITQVAIYVPLNPDLSTNELVRHLDITGADAIMVRQDESPGIGHDLAAFNLPVIKMCSYRHGSDANFVVNSTDLPVVVTSMTACPCGEDVGVVLTTSGTTSKPKVVPLTHTNLCWAAKNNVEFFNLGENDRCLNIIPQYHIYSIVASILSTLAAGGSLICTMTFRPDEFVINLGRLAPTWYAASPSIHQAVLEFLGGSKALSVRHSLKFIRSGGAPLSAKLQKELEQYFGVMVIQGYGLTETSAMGTRNPPIPGRIKPESAGVASGCEVKILGEDGHPLAQGQVGMIVMKGQGVTPGYEYDEDSDEPSFINNWFVTGDEGYLDEDGYLFITGRTKEIINRGGEKFSPYEVEHALACHPDVLDVAVYAGPHPRLGEVPMAMVILRPEAKTGPADLKLFLRGKIALHKIPAEFTQVQEIPKSTAGKVQRRFLHKYELRSLNDEDEPKGLQHHAMANGIALWSEFEVVVAQAWKKVLKLDSIDISDDFFDLGGDSLLFLDLVVELEKALGRSIPLETIINKWTFNQQVAELSASKRKSSDFRFLIPIRATGESPPLFCVHGVSGSPLTFRPLADYMSLRQPIWAFWLNPGDKILTCPLDITVLAKKYIREMRKVRASGPYLIAGQSLGGKIAFEMARQLRVQNEKVSLLALIDTLMLPPKTRQGLTYEKSEVIRKFTETPHRGILPYIREKAMARIRRVTKRPRKMHECMSATSKSSERAAIREALRDASRRYQPGYYEGPVIYFRAESDNKGRSLTSAKRWLKYADNIEIIPSPGRHGQMIREPYLSEFASKLATAIQQATSRDTGS